MVEVGLLLVQLARQVVSTHSKSGRASLMMGSYILSSGPHYWLRKVYRPRCNNWADQTLQASLL